jgi:tetratricopeptide (TPR) repeat protein
VIVRVALGLLLLLLPGRLTAQIPGSTDAAFDSIARRGIDRVYNLEFERAEEDFSGLVRMRPFNPAGHFFLAMVDWWRILTDLEDERYDDRFLGALDRVIDLCDSLLEARDNDVNAIFFKGGAIGFQGRLLFHRSDYLAAASAGRRALPLVQEATALDPDNYDILLGSGIYNYYAEVIPEQYPFVKPLVLFIPPGDKKKGLQQLTLASERATYASVEASYFLLQAYYFHERDYVRTLALARMLHTRFPNNMMFHRYVGRALVSMGNWTEATAVFDDIRERAVRGQRGYGAGIEREAVYYVATGHLQAHRWEDALTAFYRCDELSRVLDKKEASGYMAMANLKIGMIYDIQGKRSLALGQYRKVRQMKEFRDSHEQADRYAASPYRAE